MIPGVSVVVRLDCYDNNLNFVMIPGVSVVVMLFCYYNNLNFVMIPGDSMEVRLDCYYDNIILAMILGDSMAVMIVIIARLGDGSDDIELSISQMSNWRWKNEDTGSETIEEWIGYIE